MSVLTSFVISHFIPALESAFIAHEPEMQAALLAEVEAFGSQLGAWVLSKAASASSTDASSAASAAEASA